LGRTLGLNTGTAWLGALLLAASPLYIILSLQTMSDVPAMVWVTAAILGAWKSRERRWLALAAGMAFSVSVLVRPTDFLALLPVAIALGLSRQRWLAFIAGVLPGAIFQGGLNFATYGNVMTTGYGDVHSLFGWQYAPETLVQYIVWLPVVLTPLVLLAIALPLLRRHAMFAMSACMAAWVLVFPVFYLFYSYTHNDWWGLRFVLLALPPLAVAALLGGHGLCIRLGLHPRAWWLAPAMIAVVVHGALWAHHLHAFSVGRSERVYPEMAVWLQDHVPANSAVAAMQPSGALFYYTKFPIIRWDMITPGDFQRIAAACTAAGMPVYATLFPREIEFAHGAEFPWHVPGRWTQIGTVRHVSIWRYDPPSAAQ
jgi:4-amino-4-deoxy-L-arabinose transferase-like glycosyltransferase